MVSKVRKNDKSMVTFLLKQTNRITVHLISFKEHEIVAVYDKLRKQLVTALPSDCKEVTNIFSYAAEMDEL